MSLVNVRKALLFVFAILLSSVVYADPAWIDVRTSVEHMVDNIPGDVRISHEDIVPEVEKLYPDKATEIHLYCRSGARAGVAISKLQEAGYTDVVNAGGIDDARKERSLDIK